MQYPILILSDLHLVDDPSCAYRWGLFPWLYQECRKHRVQTVLILGDLTDAKDNHSAALVNRVVSVIDQIPVGDVRILAGNHDWLQKGHVFFRFLNRLPHVQVIDEIYSDKESPASGLFLPYSKTPGKDWSDITDWDYHYIFLHQTITGARASNGQVMDGDPDLPDFTKRKALEVYSGDIHVPQVIKGVEYVGSPYHVHFGDSFRGRCILQRGEDDAIDLHYPTISRITLQVRSLEELEESRLKPRDQVKLRISIPRSDKHSWFKIKRRAFTILKEKGVDVHGVELIIQDGSPRVRTSATQVPSPRSAPLTEQEAIVQFAQKESLPPDVAAVALELVDKGMV